MTGKDDFERGWLAKFASAVEAQVGPIFSREVMNGSEGFSMLTDRLEVIEWTGKALDHLEEHIGDLQTGEILTRCACRYPVEDLCDIREEYARTGDLQAAHHLLEKRFVTFLRDTLDLEEGMIKEILRRGWGLAGVLMGGGTIIATKIPKSGNLKEYMEETDPVRKRQAYCHCPRVRDALQLGQSIPETYCFCGAGYYRSIWEEIVQGEVEVEVLESVLAGGEVCRIAVRIPGDTSYRGFDEKDVC